MGGFEKANDGKRPAGGTIFLVSRWLFALDLVNLME
jgi:hypothetical protein